MGSLIDELQRRESAARAEAEELRGRIAELADRLPGVEERLLRVHGHEKVPGYLTEDGTSDGAPGPAAAEAP